MSGRSIAYSSSPLLASKTPVWRSKFIVAALALAFVGLAGRAAYVQVIGNDFFQRQGEVRFARTLELPANRGRILDRNGLILATSVVAQSVWAIPEDVDKAVPDLRKLAQPVDAGGLFGTGLGEHQLQLVAVAQHLLRPGLGADADPVDAVRGLEGAVGLNRDLKAEATKPPSVNLPAQQRRFERWRHEFNHERPHESLGQRYDPET